MEARAAWLEERKSGIGGTDAAAILGFSKYQTAFDVWLDKTGQAPPRADSEAMWWGRELEELIARRFTERTGSPVHSPGQIFRDQIHPFLIASPDRLHLGRPRGLEIKTASQYLADEWGESGTDEIPSSYLVQCQHYLMVMGCEAWDVAVLIGGQDVRFFEIRPDREFIDSMRERLIAWWTEHIINGQRPPVDGGEGAKAWLTSRWPRHTGPRLSADQNAEAIGQRLLDVIRELDFWDSEQELSRNALRMAIGDAEGIDGDGWRATWKLARGAKHTDWEAVALSLLADAQFCSASTGGVRRIIFDEIVARYTMEKPGTRRLLFRKVPE